MAKVLIGSLKKMQDNIEAEIGTKITSRTINKQLETAGWYRIAKYNDLGATAKSFIVNINTRYNSNENMSVTLNVNLSYKKATVTNVSANIRDSVVNKIRVVQEDDATYLEIYYRHSTKNYVFIEILSQGGVTILDFEVATDTATVLNEIKIPEIEYGNGKLSDTVYTTQIKRLEVGGIYEVSIVRNYNTNGNANYRGVLYGILSLPCGYAYNADGTGAGVVVRPKFNIIANYSGTDTLEDTTAKVVCEGNKSEINIDAFKNAPQVYICYSNATHLKIEKVNIRKIS